MANQFPRGMRSIRSFSLTACAFSNKPTFKRVDSFWCPIHVDIRKLKLSKFCLGRWQIPLQLLCRMLIRDIDVSYNFLVLVVRRSDNTLHWINLYPVDNSVRFATTYPLYSDLSVGKRYPPFTQLGPEY